METVFSTVRGLVIRSVRYKDADCVLTVLTDKMGRITVKARGAARKNSALSVSSQLFSCSDMVLYESAGRYTLNEAQVVSQFEGLRRDLRKMALASYFAEVLSSGEEAENDAGVLLRLALNCLYALCEKFPELAVKTAFELKFATLSGYMPQLEYCADCANEVTNGIVDPLSGEIYCGVCGAKRGFYFSERALSAAKHIVSCEMKKLLSFSCDENELKTLSDFSGEYLKNCLERPFRTLDFYYGLGDFI